jgi:hypothetical protein
MKLQFLSFLVVGLLCISGLAAVGMGKEAASNEKTLSVQFSEPTITVNTLGIDLYSQVNVQGTDGRLYSAGQPTLPFYSTQMNFPLGTNIVKVEFIPQEIQTTTIPYKIQPAPQPVVLDTENAVAVYSANTAIYTSANYFPTTWVTFSTGGGLDTNGQHTTFLTIRVYPVRYSPTTNTIQYIQSGELKITYKNPTKPLTFGTGYQMVIIAPAKFSTDLQQFVDFKNTHGINTTLMTIEDIYSQYTGYDKPEQIKYFIKYALDTWNTKYVLIVGGVKGYIFGNGGRDDANQGVKNWYVPVRYTNLDEGGTEHDPGYISDLYYADIYDSHGNFSTWDSNGDNIYAKWKGFAAKDIIDLYPDLYVGRLPCRNSFEVKQIVKKIIDYESTPADPSWFNNMVLVGGDSFDDRPGSNIPEGEFSTSFVQNESMATFTPIELFASNRNISDDQTPTPTNIINSVTAGCGFLYFDGHGNPLSWNTHWFDLFSWEKGQTPGGINVYGMLKFKNGNKLPVCVVGGCHNSMFNITLLWSIDSKNTFTWVYGQPDPRSWSEMMLFKKNGGGIACIGNTGLGYGQIGMVDGVPACVLGLGGYVERMFFKSYNEGSTKNLGDSWGGAITRYLIDFPGMQQQADCKTVEEWALMGDPSLQIGGITQ